MFSIIVILSENNCIGKEGKLLWHLPEDLKRFKNITLGHKMIMGRKCFLSIPKVLEKRENIVVTRDKNFFIEHKDVTMCYDLDDIISKYKNSEEEVFIIGGGEIYEIFLPLAEKLYLTHVDEKIKGDVYFPIVDYSMYKVTFSSEKYYNEKENVYYKFVNYEKNKS
ncbi:MAG: dihydrofolate reductase [Lachnospirales bacterium]